GEGGMNRQANAHDAMTPQNSGVEFARSADDFPVARIGEQADLRYDSEYLGAGAETLAAVASGKHAFR
ncbi:hypothetical protein C3731_22140, partial [Brucella oryzae]